MSNQLVSTFHALRARALSFLDGKRDVALLLGRLSVGLLFMSTGWGKVHHLDQVTRFFESLGVPMPGANAVLVGYTELLGGAALVVGLFTRVAAFPLAITMVVALLTAKRGDVHGLFDLVAQDELTYLVVLVMLVILGPGRVALDHLLAGNGGPAAGRTVAAATVP